MNLEHIIKLIQLLPTININTLLILTLCIIAIVLVIKI